MRKTTVTARFGLVSIAMAAIALLAAPEAKSNPKSTEAEDPEGDAFIFFNFVEHQRAPGYLDLIRGEVKLQGGIFLFNLTVAAPVPDDPYVPQGQFITWSFLIDTDPDTFPVGLPVSPGTPAPYEFFVIIQWDGTDFDAILIDRRPSLVGEDAIVSAIPFDIDGNELSASVSRRMMDRPRSFVWSGNSTAVPSFGENYAFLPVDRVPDDGEVAWPAE
jgi:hypothetical protein